MLNVTLKQLRAFAALLRRGTVIGAAEDLNVTPPAVTMQLRLLEQIAGIPLYERTSEGIRPTDAGQELLAATRGIETLLADCGDALETLKGMDGGRISVGVVSTAKYFAPLALAGFAKAHANVDVRLSVGNRGETIAGLKNFDLDIVVMGRPPEDIAVENAVIGDHPHIIIGPPDHVLANRRRIPRSRLAEETFLLREAGSGTRVLMQRLFEEVGVNPRTGMEIGSNETIKQAVMAGLGIALISAHTVAHEVEEGRLAVFDVVGFPVKRQWFVVKRADKRLLPAAKALWDFFVTSGADYLPEAAAK